MDSKLLKVGALLVAGAAAVAVGTMAHADTINTTGVLCQNYNAWEALDIDYLPWGVENVAGTARSVICSVPRSPLAPGVTTGTIAVDGMNYAGFSTTCTVYAVTGHGLLGSHTFTEAAPTGPTNLVWRHTVSLSSSELRASGYISVLCTIPGDVKGLITGLTSMQ